MFEGVIVCVIMCGTIIIVVKMILNNQLSKTQLGSLEELAGQIKRVECNMDGVRREIESSDTETEHQELAARIEKLEDREYPPRSVNVALKNQEERITAVYGRLDELETKQTAMALRDGFKLNR